MAEGGDDGFDDLRSKISSLKDKGLDRKRPKAFGISKREGKKKLSSSSQAKVSSASNGMHGFNN